jgi:hypothetical protein
MAQKPKAVRPKEEKPQSERFIETAREAEADESGDEFERAFQRIIKSRTPKPDG